MAQTCRDRHGPLGVLVKVFPKLSDAFILEEILGLERQGVALRVYALAPTTDASSSRVARRTPARLPNLVRSACRRPAPIPGI